MLVGVGGQGVVLASNLLARAFLESGYYVKQSEIHGMAQRGGSVTSFVRAGSRPGELVYAPNIDAGHVDALLAFEKLEALRFAHFLTKDGLLLYSTQEIIPTTVSALGSKYPEDIEGELRGRVGLIASVDVVRIAEECGNPRVASVVLVGSIAAALPIEADIWERSIRAVVPRAVDANLKAFAMGREAVGRKLS
jgi:indolepyruvate ferredoxin oxidoreductase, beta subunit